MPKVKQVRSYLSQNQYQNLRSHTPPPLPHNTQLKRLQTKPHSKMSSPRLQLQSYLQS